MASNTDTKDNRLLAKLLEPLVPNPGSIESPIKNVRFIRSDTPIPRHPVVYEPSIVIIAQGHKTGYLGNKVYRYDPCNYLVLSVPLPFDCETSGTPEEPLLGVMIGVDVTTVSEVLLEMDDSDSLSSSVARGNLLDAINR